MKKIKENKEMKEMKKDMMDAVNLEMLFNKFEGDALRNANTTCERFLCTAALLEQGEYLGWQMDTKKQSVVMFASRKTQITMEDFSWIARFNGNVSPASSEWLDDLFEGNRKVYVLVPVMGSERDADSPIHCRTYSPIGEDGEDDSDVFLDGELYEMLEEEGAVLRFAAGHASEGMAGHGILYISLPNKMSLKLRGMISVTFPHHVADEIHELPDETDKTVRLTNECFTKGMYCMFVMLLQQKDGRRDAESTDNEHNVDDGHNADDAGDGWDEMDAGAEPGFGQGDAEEQGHTSIDELELSVRTYNCLKRADITTVEELQQMDYEDFMGIRNMADKCVAEIMEKLAGFQCSKAEASVQTINYREKLDELVGLSEVKEQVRKIAAYAKMKKKMSENGDGSIPAALNMGFVGRPGTAKTTVARIVAGIFHELGLVSSDQVVEAGRGDLVAGYVGHTAVKVRALFKRAKGKVLFIDEAYSLVDDRKGSFGDEAISTLVQEMENNRKDTIVIFAGYPDEMEDFFSRNPGLRSRVPYMINFSDYSAEEMVKITELEAKNRGFAIDDAAYEKLTAICSEAVGRPDSGNGRFCRNLVENAVLGYAARVYGDDEEAVCDDVDYMLTAEDFTAPVKTGKTKKSIGFCV